MSGLRLAVVLGLIAGLLVGPVQVALPTEKPIEDAGSPAADRPVTVLAGPERLPRSVLDELRSVADRSRAPIDGHTVTSGDELLDRLRGADAELVVVAVHGDETGVRVGGDRVPRHRVVAALRESSAGEVLFATCDLDLPARLGSTDVRGYDGRKVDAEVATVDAIARWAAVYDDRPRVAERLASNLQTELAEIGGRSGYVLRSVMPQDPLTMTRSGGSYWIDQCNDHRYMDDLYCTSVYGCRDSDGDGWVEDRWFETEVRPVEDACREVDANDEDEIREDSKRAARGSGRLVGAFAEMTWESLKEGGMVGYQTDATVDGTRYRVFLTFGKEAGQRVCVPLFALDSGTVKGVSRGALKEALEDKADDQVDRMTKWTQENDGWIGLRACGRLTLGIPADSDQTTTSGRVSAQLGIGGQSEFQVGYGDYSVDVDYGMNVYVDGRLDVRLEESREVRNAAECQSSECFKLTVKMSENGNAVPWGAYTFLPYSWTLWGPWTGSWIVDYGDDEQQSRSSGAQGSVVLPADDGQLLYSVMALSDSQLKAAADDPDRRRRLESRLGTPIDDLIGEDVVVDLTDDTFCDVFTASDDCGQASRELPGGYVKDGVAGDLAGIDPGNPTACMPGFDLDLEDVCGSGEDASGPSTSASSSTRTCASTDQFRTGDWPNETVGNRSAWTGNASTCTSWGDASVASSGSAHRPKPPVEELCERSTSEPCPWVSAATVCALTVENSLEGDATWDVCDAYLNATASRSLAESEGDRFRMRMRMTNASHLTWTTAVDLCPSGGIAGVCEPGHVDATGLDSSDVWVVDEFYDQKLRKYLGGSTGLACVRQAMAPLLGRPVDATEATVESRPGNPVASAVDCGAGPAWDGYGSAHARASRKASRVESTACTMGWALFEDNAPNYPVFSDCTEGDT